MLAFGDSKLYKFLKSSQIYLRLVLKIGNHIFYNIKQVDKEKVQGVQKKPQIIILNF